MFRKLIALQRLVLKVFCARLFAGGTIVYLGVSLGWPPESSAQIDGGAWRDAEEQVLIDQRAKLYVPILINSRASEPYRVREFLESRRVLESQNAAPEYLLAFADISPEANAIYPAEKRQKRLQQVDAVAKAINEAADLRKLLSGDVSSKEVEQVILLARPFLEKNARAQRLPNCVFQSNLKLYDSPLHVQACVLFSRLTLIRLFNARSNGDFHNASSAVSQILRTSRDLRPLGSLISQLMSRSIDDATCQWVCKLTLSQPGLTADNCDTLINLLAAHAASGLDQLQEGYRVEYLTAMSELDLLKSRLYGYRYFVDHICDGVDNIDVTAEQFAAVDWDAQKDTCDKLYAVLLAQLEKSPVQLPSRWDVNIKREFQPEKMIILKFLFQDPDQPIEAILRSRARLAGTMGLIAIRRYQLAHETTPPDLITACREAGLTESLIDPYTANSIRYVIQEGRPTVYSVGKDLIDQGGRTDWQFGKRPGDFIFQLDE